MIDTALPGKTELSDLHDIELVAVVEIGRTIMPLKHAMQLGVGDVIALSKLAGESYSVTLNGHPFGEGEIVVVQDMLACRLTRMAEAIDMREEEGDR